MDFTQSERSREMRECLAAFMDECVYPAEAVYARSRGTSLDPHHIPPVVEDLKIEARSRGLWNLFLPAVSGLSNTDYAPLAELMGRSPVLAAEACNCSAPDTGNMELLHLFGTAEQQRRWLDPLLEGQIRSCFAMTEPDVASSDATNIAARISREGDELVITGRKWWITGAADPRCRVALVLGVSDPDAAPHQRHSVALVPLDTPGVILVRDLTVFGYQDHQGHCELRFEGARVPAANLLGPAGRGVRHRAEPPGPRARAPLHARHRHERAGAGAHGAPGPVADRVRSGAGFPRRGTAGHSRVAHHDRAAPATGPQDRLVARHRRPRGARIEIAAIKAAVPRAAAQIIDRAIQVHGGLGLSGDTPLAQLYAASRALRIADGPDDVHLESVARRELTRYRPA